MAPNTWIHVMMPCLRPRPKQKDEFEQRLQAENDNQEEPFSAIEKEIERNASVAKSSPQAFDGIEPVTLPDKSRPQTLLVTELPCPSPIQSAFRPAVPRLTIGRSKTDGPPFQRKDNKSLKGKRKRSQTLNISGPTGIRKGPSDDPKLALPLTYPSPSRQRPEKLLVDRRDPISEQERPRTAPTSQDFPRRKDSFPLRSDSFHIRSHAWRLAPLPPLPALQIENTSHQRNDSSTTPIKRKPLPLRIRGSSDPAPSSPRIVFETPSYQIGCAVEMPGSLPQVVDKSPVELAAAPKASPLPVEKGPDTPLAELEGMTREAARHNAFPSISSLPASPTSPIYAHRLSEGARDLLNFFPTTPKLSRANSIKSVKSIKRAASAEPPLSPRLIEFAGTQKYPKGFGAATVIGKTSDLKIQQIDIVKPLVITKASSAESDYTASPATVSPRTQVIQPGSRASPALYIPKADDDKSLPPTPQTAGFSRGRFISLAAGLELSGMPEFDLVGLGISTDQNASKRTSAAESIPIFLSGGIEV